MMLSMQNISVDFKKELGFQKQRVLKSVSFNVEKGDCLGILGESGSGKRTLGRVITGLLSPTEGEYHFEEKSPYLIRNHKKYLSESISIVFQDYTTSVNPRFTVYDIIYESLKLYEKRSNQKLIYENEIVELLNRVGLNENYIARYPHQLSGGQLQRVCIARAIALKPKVILFDEALSSLDAHTQVQIMDLLKDLKRELDLTYIFITHDLTSVTYLCNKVMFLYKGEITEFIDVKNIASTKDLYATKLLNTLITI